MSLKCHKIEINHKHAVKTCHEIEMYHIHAGKNAQNFRYIWNRQCNWATYKCTLEWPPRRNCGIRSTVALCSWGPGLKLADWLFPQIFFALPSLEASGCPRQLPCTPCTASLSPKVWVPSLLDLPPITNASLIFLLTQERAFFPGLTDKRRSNVLPDALPYAAPERGVTVDDGS